jgi:hypothetical protein
VGRGENQTHRANSTCPLPTRRRFQKFGLCFVWCRVRLARSCAGALAVFEAARGAVRLPAHGRAFAGLDLLIVMQNEGAWLSPHECGLCLC